MHKVIDARLLLFEIDIQFSWHHDHLKFSSNIVLVYLKDIIYLDFQPDCFKSQSGKFFKGRVCGTEKTWPTASDSSSSDSSFSHPAQHCLS